MSRNSNGFTLIELMLAMGFVAGLLILIAATVIQFSNIYNRGTLLKSTNESASKLISDFQEVFSSSQAFDLDSRHYISDNDGGRLCTGSYSYIWNKQGDTPENQYSNSDFGIINLIKVSDPGGYYCTNGNSKIEHGNVVEDLLSGTAPSLALYSFSITEIGSIDNLTGQGLYLIQFRLGSDNVDAISYDSGSASCKVPSKAGSDLSYCYINNFNAVVRAGGGEI